MADGVPFGPTRLIAVVAAIWMLFVAGVYVPDIGRGFVKDDFSWIERGRTGLSEPGTLVLPTLPGFYRPLVGASFGINYWLRGLDARSYGFTNLALYAACAAAMVLLFRALGVGAAAAVVGAFAWAINPHGISMAVVWISGRTSLLLTLFAVLSATAFVRGRRVTGTLLFFAALLSKEEAVMLPAILAALVATGGPERRAALGGDLAAMALALAVYFALRVQTPAFTPFDAPSFYRFTDDPRLLVTNVLEYLDRGATIFAVVLLLAALACRVRPALGERERRLAGAAAIWFAGGYALTVLIPVRSSLYAVFPSVGTALVTALVVDGLRRAAPTRTTDLRIAAVLASVLLFIPIYRIRNGPWVEPARVSTRTMAVVAGDLPGLPDHGVIVLTDEASPHSNFRSAFGGLATDAVRLYTGRPFDALVVWHPPGDTTREAPADVVARYQLTHGAVVRVE